MSGAATTIEGMGSPDAAGCTPEGTPVVATVSTGAVTAWAAADGVATPRGALRITTTASTLTQTTPAVLSPMVRPRRGRRAATFAVLTASTAIGAMLGGV